MNIQISFPCASLRWQLAHLLAAAVLGSTAVGASADTAEFTLVPTNAMPMKGGYMPQRLRLSANKPNQLKKEPDGLVAPLYGVLQIGPADATSEVVVIVDEPEDKPWRLYVDSNGDGDLTDDAEPAWRVRGIKGRDGKEWKQSSGGALIRLGKGADAPLVRLGMYRFDKSDPARAAFKNMLFYYSDYATQGTVEIGGKTYKAMLSDDATSGDFRGKAGDRSSGVRLLLDLNGNGRFDGRGENFDVRKPFNIAGTTYELADIAPDGTSFKVEKSSQEVAEIKPPPVIEPGTPAIAFTAKTTEGKDVRFPSDFKGRLVMLDFWATWCGPCIGELPNLTNAYNRFHAEGFDVLGVSLDRPKAEKKLADFTRQHNMPWPQIYDGKFWEAAIAELYGIQSIPSAFLVDGATGKVVATGSTLRGRSLSRTVEAALRKQKSVEAR